MTEKTTEKTHQMVVEDVVQAPEPQETLAAYWKKLRAEKPGYIKSILPPDAYEESNAEPLDGTYNNAREACLHKVQRIVRQCRSRNEMFTDTEFDIAADFCDGFDNCLRPLMPGKDGQPFRLPKKDRSKENGSDSDEVGDDDYDSLPRPGCVHRVSWIFKDAKFTAGAPRRYNVEESQAHRPKLPKLAGWPRVTAILSYIKGLPSTAITALTTAAFICTILALHTSRDNWTGHLAISALLAVALMAFHQSFGERACMDFSAAQIVQGQVGDCWWISGVTALSNQRHLLEKICVAFDQDCGVYGFLFFRDGQWIYTLVDDFLYLRVHNINHDERLPGRTFAEYAAIYKDDFQTGSKALHFAACGPDNTFWVSLLEKAYAKAHGDYGSLHGGFSNEALEDLTGGVSRVMCTEDFLDKNQLWRELRCSLSNSVFTASTPAANTASLANGLYSCHDYPILKAIELPTFDWLLPWRRGHGVRLLMLRNVHGDKDGRAVGKWKGAWSNGSEEWTFWRILLLRWKFRKDGSFLMSFEDALDSFTNVVQTRLLDNAKWTQKQAWARINVSWHATLNDVAFSVTLHKASHVILVLSKLDEQYFKGLQGRYEFTMNFLLLRRGASVVDYILCTTEKPHPAFSPWRSAHAEADLEAGEYVVLLKVTANHRSSGPEQKQGVFSTEDAIRLVAPKRPKKLEQVARNYDTAHRRLVDLSESTDEKTSDSTKKADDDEAATAIGLNAMELDAESAKTTVPPAGAVSDGVAQDPGSKAAAAADPVEPAKGSGVSEDRKDCTPANGENQKTSSASDGSSDKKDDSSKEKDSEKQSKDEKPAAKVTVPHKAELVAWNAVCGVGLRVICHDPGVEVKVCRR